MLTNLDDFEKKVKVPEELATIFSNDMIFQVLQQFTPEQLVVFCQKNDIGLNEKNQITSLSYQAVFKIHAAYFKEVDNEFKYNGMFSQRFENYQQNVIAQLSSGNDVMYNYLCELIFQYSSPLYSYFEAIPVDYDRDIINHFSLLPPVFRYYVLADFYGAMCMKKLQGGLVDSNYSTTLIDKLNLAILKMTDANTALNWVELNRPTLIELGMYDTCRGKIEALAGQPTQYQVFSEAYPVFREKWQLRADTQEKKLFTSTMVFFYNAPILVAEQLLSEL